MKKPEKRGPLSLFPRLFYRGNAKKRQKMHFFSLFSIFSKKSEKMLKIDFPMSVASSCIKKRKKTQKNTKKTRKKRRKFRGAKKCQKRFIPISLPKKKVLARTPKKVHFFAFFHFFCKKVEKMQKNVKKRIFLRSFDLDRRDLCKKRVFQ